MKLETIINAVNNVKNGTCVRIGYTSEVPVKATYRNDVTIKKIVATTGRLGVRYANIKTVKERLAAKAAGSAKENNFSWVVKDKIKYNPNTGKNYLSVTTFPKGDNTKSIYEVRKGTSFSYFYTKKELKEYAGRYIRESYFNNSKNPTEVYNVNIENVFRVGDVVKTNV